MYKYIATFSEHVARFFEVFPKEQIFITFIDYLKDSPEREFKRLCAFLKIDQEATINFSVQNQNNVWKNKLLRDFLTSKAFAKMRMFLPEMMRETAKGLLLKKEARPFLPNHIKLEVQYMFRGEIERLSRLIDLDLSPWQNGRFLSYPR